MKKLILVALSLLAISTASAQISAFPQNSSEGIIGYTLPRTIITVKVTQEREIIIRGPYARYASQYFGILTAPMSDRETYRIISAEIIHSQEPDPTQVFVFNPKGGKPTNVFNWLTSQPATSSNELDSSQQQGTDIAIPFKDMAANLSFTERNTSSIEKSAELMAADAADVIYRLRRKRIELITGEIGDAVFGAGLKDALQEINRLEDEYMSLFIGKRDIQQSVLYFSILPERGKDRTTAFRFNETSGALPSNDLSGRPINLEFVPESISQSHGKQSGSRTVTYRVPQVSNIKLTDGQRVLSTQRAPIYQNGYLIEAPIL